MWDEALEGIKTHLVTETKHSRLKFVAELPSGVGGPLSPKMDHLVCFLPGTIALGATKGRTLAEARLDPKWTEHHEEDMRLAAELMKTCWGMYAVTGTGLAPEIAWFEADDDDLKPVPGSRKSRKPSQCESPIASFQKVVFTLTQPNVSIAGLEEGFRHQAPRRPQPPAARDGREPVHDVPHHGRPHVPRMGLEDLPGVPGAHADPVSGRLHQLGRRPHGAPEAEGQHGELLAGKSRRTENTFLSLSIYRRIGANPRRLVALGRDFEVSLSFVFSGRLHAAY